MKINCDYGESYGRYSLGESEEILKYVDMVNIACGFHAGDPKHMLEALRLAKKHNVLVGAHPSYFDVRGFGRTPMNVASDVLYADVLYQLAAFQGMCQSLDMRMNHVKPHGALYNTCSENQDAAESVLKAIMDIDKSVHVVGLSGSNFLAMASKMGLKVVHEVFADRQYHENGQLVSRQLKGSVLNDVEAMQKQVTCFREGSGIEAREGGRLFLRADTLCIHGDGDHAVSIAKRLRGK